jgi:uncharacterized cupredoxin-like copper-binding protein
MILKLAALTALVVATPSHAPKPNVVTVTARDFAFELPASIPAGVTTFRFVNKGAFAHHMTIVRLEEGRTAAEGLKAVMVAGYTPRPGWMHPVGGPQSAKPGVEANATVLLEPGNYLVFCEVPGPEPVPHYMKGMAKALTVTGPARGGALPVADVALSLTEYDFTFAQPLTRGRHTVAVTNHGSQLHMAVINRFPPGQTLDDFIAWSDKPQGKPAPGWMMGGVTEIPPGATVTFTRNFIPGHYGMICFTPDSKDGRPHFLHGMQKEFEVR